MKNLLPLIEPLIVKALLSRGSAKNSAASIGLWITAGCLGLVSLIFLALAGFIGLQSVFARDIAALITGGAIMALALGFTWLGHFLFKKKSRQQEKQVYEVKEITDQLLQTIADEVDDSIEQNPKTAVLISGVAGVLAGTARR